MKRAVRSKTFNAGLAMRKRVVGPDYVAASLKNTDEFWMPFQEMITEHGWGASWIRPELPLKTRSMLTLAFCIALNRPHEIRVHLRGAIRNGVTKTEIRELIMHSFVYCGGPAALDAFNNVRAALPEIEAKETALRAAKRKKKAKR
jgi:4-carboxymuconolactone decarboxylase